MKDEFGLLRSKDIRFKYMILSRLQQDCEYYLGFGGRRASKLWAQDKVKQIECMELLYNSFVENNEDILTWTALEDIARYKIRMLEPERNKLYIDKGGLIWDGC